MFKKRNFKLKIVLTLLLVCVIIYVSPIMIHSINQYIYMPKIEERFETCATNSVFDMKEDNLFDDKTDFSQNFFETSSIESLDNYIFCGTTPALKLDDSGKKYIALTFDDGPHKKYTKDMLRVLKEKNVKATFFLLGQNISGNEELLRQMLEQDCEIGIHSYTHKLFTKITNEEISEQLLNTQSLIVSATGKQATMVRPPYGSVDERVKSYINMPIILWHLDSRDWSYLNTDKIYKRVIKQADNYDIILMHDIFKTSVESAKLIIDDLLKDGYEFVTISELNALNMQRKSK